MALKVAKRGLIQPFMVMDVMRAANMAEAAGKDILHLEVGQPSTPAPNVVLKAATKALDTNLIGYTDAFGLPQLRERISQHYKNAYAVDIGADNICITTGSSGGFILSFLAAFDAGDKVALASPGYPAYRNILKALDVEVINIETGPETNYQPTPELLGRVKGNIDGLIVASPSNPTGTMISEKGLRDLSNYCQERGIRIISDEIYHGITFEKNAHSMAEFDSECLIVNSFSKYYSMTGWRLGWMVFPDKLSRSIECLAQNLFISAPTLSQIAAIKAFGCKNELDSNVARYRTNRDLLLSELPKAGFTELSHAEGAFYIYADISAMTDDSAAFCKKILNETGVAITPGVDFDPERGRRYARFSFAGSTEDMEKAAGRLKKWAEQ
ncbi:MAG: aminotransferase class I/II-fold pyridoxal phosphate-dependent enzyme [Rhodospirillaceae bacterium]|nr:aminotransferase class I/II-fold pyridoxal phosphate-dependent enzyme [Rhodospirillaceae bacterium]